MLISTTTLSTTSLTDSSTSSGWSTPEHLSTSASATNPLAGQILTISYGTFTHSLSVTTAFFPAALQLRDDFLHHLQTADEPVTLSSLVEFWARFLGFTVHRLEQTPRELTDDLRHLLTIALETFDRDILQQREVHGVVYKLEDTSETTQSTILAACVRARHALRRLSRAATPPSALLTAAQERKARLYAVFGGQGNDEHYFEELRTLWQTYRPLVEELIIPASSLLQRESMGGGSSNRFYHHGLDALSWLEHPERTPASAYLIGDPISMPLIGLLQLAWYRVVGRVAGVTPAQLQTALAVLALCLSLFCF